MIKQILDVPMKEVTNVIHISDVHIRNLKRHREYKIVFNNLYEEIKNIITPTTIIVVSGDIVHSKTEMSPELVALMGDFFKNLAELGTVIVTAGNHDANLSNTHRLDALSPIIDLMKNDSIYYLKDSGIYSIGTTDISVMSIFEPTDTYVQAKDLDGDYKIAIYHGPITHSKTDMGFSLSDGLSKSFFDGFHVVLLGDIHKRQTIQEYREEEIEIDEKELSKYLKDGWEKI